MWLTPSSTARRSTLMAWSRFAGTASGISARPCWGRRMAPNPSRLTTRSPSGQVPAAAAGVTGRAVMDKEAPFLERAPGGGRPGSGQAFVDKGEGQLVEPLPGGAGDVAQRPLASQDGQ